MSISDQLYQWQQSKSIVELHYINARSKKIIHGRIYSFDPNEQNILFYDEDAKKIENVSLAQIEDMIASEPMEQIQARQVSTEIKNEPEKRNNPSLKEEVLAIIELLPSNDLYAILPLLKHLAKQVDK
jgi:hypothetical protein